MVIERIGEKDEAAFAALVALYREAIDPSEQKPVETLRAMLGMGDRVFLVARDAGEFTGFAIAFAPVGEDWWLLEYMAVDPARRGEGLGEALFRASGSHAGKRAFGIVEVEQAGGSAEQARRLRFYARLGCRRLGLIDYELPKVGVGDPPPMMLLVVADPGVGGIAREAARSWLVATYAWVYDQPADDPRIDAMLAGEGETLALGAI